MQDSKPLKQLHYDVQIGRCTKLGCWLDRPLKEDVQLSDGNTYCRLMVFQNLSLFRIFSKSAVCSCVVAASWGTAAGNGDMRAS